MIFPGFPGVPSFFQVFQVEWEPCKQLLVQKAVKGNHRCVMPTKGALTAFIGFSKVDPLTVE